jgi:hypothetical protein
MEDTLTRKLKCFPYKPAMRVGSSAPNPPSVLINSSTGNPIISLLLVQRRSAAQLGYALHQILGQDQ